jgi:hypothetical protein
MSTPQQQNKEEGLRYKLQKRAVTKQFSVFLIKPGLDVTPPIQSS